MATDAGKIEAPNIERLERAILAFGNNASFNVQPSTIRPDGLLWSANYRVDGRFYYGSGDTLAEAISNIRYLAPHPHTTPSLATIEAEAA